MRIKIVSFSVIFFAIVSFFVYDKVFSQAAIEQRIITHKGYDLELLDDDISINFAYKPEWFNLGLNKPERLMQKISEIGDSEVYIEEVVRQEERVCISLLIKPSYNSRQGDFLFVDTINSNGTITSAENGQWSILRDEKELNPLRFSFGHGSGPGNRVSIFLDIDRAKDFDNSIQIMYKGLNKYAYKRI